MRHLRYGLAAITLATITACGGGGGDDLAPAYLAGTYTGTYIKTQDNCFIGGTYNGVQQTVSIEGSGITVRAGTLTLKGGASDDGGLRATYETSTSSSISRATITYSMPAGQSAPGNGTFDSEILVQGIDKGTGFTCNLRYNGQVKKIG
jgi:hypothetical protein